MPKENDILEKEKKLIALTAEFCRKKLDEDYLRICELLIKKMGRKRNVPFEGGKLEIWAAAVINAVGTVNFLFDKSFQPYVSVEELNDYFGTKKSSTANKSREIRSMFKMNHFDHEFSTKWMNENNPLNELVMVDGLIVHINSLPPEHREMVKNARLAGKDISFITKKADNPAIE